MPIRPKTERRLALLLLMCVGTGALLYGAYRFRQHQNHITLEQMRQVGMAAYQNKDWKTAIDKLGQYVSAEENSGDDSQTYDEALFALAQATDNTAHTADRIN